MRNMSSHPYSAIMLTHFLESQRRQQGKLYCISCHLEGRSFCLLLLFTWASLAAQTVKNLLAVQETWVCSLGWEDSPGEKNGNPLQYSWLRNPVDRGAWRATVRGIGKSGTWLSSAFSFTCSLGPKDLFGYIKSM